MAKKVVYNFDSQIEYFISEYKRKDTPVQVSFRKLLPNLNKSDKHVHLSHPYPAKMLLHIPHLLLNNSILSKPNDLVLDPFCGSGTVLLESILSCRNAIGADSNPLARLISKVKTTVYQTEDLNETLECIRLSMLTIKEVNLPDVLNKDYWFLKDTQKELAKLLHVINEISNTDVKDFFLMCLSGCVKKLSLSDPRIFVPVKLNYHKYEVNSKFWQTAKFTYETILNNNVVQVFVENAKTNIERFSSFFSLYVKNRANIISKDARKLTTCLCSENVLCDSSVDLIVTSPPYAGAQKYIRASFLNIGWLGLAESDEIKILDRNTIGREEYPKFLSKSIIQTDIIDADEILKKIYLRNPVRALIAGQYIVEMKQALDESYRVLKQHGYMVLVIGNNQVCGLEFDTQNYLTHYLVEKGMQLVFKLIDNIQSYALMTKRNKTANIITKEWIIVLKK